MESPSLTNVLAAFEAALGRSRPEVYVFRLYITGATPKSLRAVRNLTRVCEEHLAGRYTLEVIDLYEYPRLAQTEQIVATPMLVKQLPLPIRQLVGDLSNEQRLLVGLGLAD